MCLGVSFQNVASGSGGRCSLTGWEMFLALSTATSHHSPPNEPQHGSGGEAFWLPHPSMRPPSLQALVVALALTRGR